MILPLTGGPWTTNGVSVPQFPSCAVLVPNLQVIGRPEGGGEWVHLWLEESERAPAEASGIGLPHAHSVLGHRHLERSHGAAWVCAWVQPR